ncbi:centromere protein S-like [Clavelina lepadiformis]|uniref:centromere protein S-like n=1 Tax=Clavelina lepadiformis TaxID=159417 RepID=UPI004043948A
MMNKSEEITEEKFKQVIHHTTAKICQEVSEETGIVYSKQAIATLAEICYRQSEMFAKDLELFTRHARRKKISADDVLMLARKTSSLHRHLEQMKN